MRCFLEDDDHTRKWSCVLFAIRAFELYSSFYKPDLFCFAIYVFVKPLCVSSSRNKHNNILATICFRRTFRNPVSRTFSSIRWVAEYRVPAPILRQSIIFFRKKFIAFMIFVCSTRIKREFEFAVKTVKQSLRSAPFDSPCAKNNFFAFHVNLSLSFTHLRRDEHIAPLFLAFVPDSSRWCQCIRRYVSQYSF